MPTASAGGMPVSGISPAAVRRFMGTTHIVALTLPACGPRRRTTGKTPVNFGFIGIRAHDGSGRVEQFPLASEVPVERWSRNSGLQRNLGQAQLGHAVAAEDLGGGGKNPLPARGVRVFPHPHSFTNFQRSVTLNL